MHDIYVMRPKVTNKSKVKQAKPDSTLYVFDFDDTLIKSTSKIRVRTESGKVIELTAAESSVYNSQPGDQFDYSAFHSKVEATPIQWTMNILSQVYADNGPGNVVILTARGNMQVVKDFMDDLGFTDIEIIALGTDSADTPMAKAAWISTRINDKEQNVEFFDDSYKNVAAVRKLKQTHPGVEIKAHHVVHSVKG
jgi:phosphoserine phosphatase